MRARRQPGARWMLLAAALVLASLCGCHRKAAPLPPAQGSSLAPATPSSARGVTPGPAAQPGQTAPGPAVQARPVAGWSLTENPRPGVSYRYLRDQAEGDFRPTVTVVARGARAAGPTDARDRAQAELRGRYPALEVLTDRNFPEWRPPLEQVTYRFTEEGVTYKLMQLYFVRSSGEVVTVTFSATASQWDYLQTDFQSILGAITVGE
jgi:hypothetical protein